MAQTLETIIAINATVGSGFAEVGSTLTQLGAQVDAISDKLIGFGKDSLKVYEDYELNMSKAKGALAATYGKDTQELNDAMTGLDEAANQWADSTRFHLKDVGEAINTAAHAKWDKDSIIANMPEAMELANAGAMDLSDAVKYLVTAQNALDVPNEDLGQFIDLWAYAASRSVGDIDTFGQTLDALGSVGRFTDSYQELFAMTGMMHDMGTEGSAAATLLRTTWMRLLAPSGVGGKVLDHLGATDEEIKTIRQDTALLNTLDFLEGYGFSAYQANGQAKPLMQTFSELRDVLAEISGGYENIGKNQQALEILNTLFGLRGIKGALNIFEGLDGGLALLEEMNAGYAEGFGAYYSETMMDTLWGQTMLWESKVEALEARTGEALAAQVEPILETIGGIVDSITSFDDGKFNALVSGLEVLAFAGPGLLATGAAFRFIAYALTPAGGIGLSLIALASAAAAINALEEADFAGKFGEMELDPTEVQNYVQKLGQDFQNATSDVNGFTEAINQCVEAYKTNSSELSSSLLEIMLTGAEVKEGSEEWERLYQAGISMINAVKAGIENNRDATREGIMESMSAGDNIDSPIFAQIMAVIDQGFQDDIDKANNLGIQLRTAMLSAFGDGHLTQDEIDKINAIMEEQEALLAQQQDRAHYLERQRLMRRARTIGIDAIREASAEVEAEREAEWETLMSRQDADYYDLGAYYDSLIANGVEIPNADGTEGTHIATEADKSAALDLLKTSQEAERNMWTARFSDFIMGLWTAGISSSELSGTWDALNTLAQSVQRNGGYIDLAASNAYDAAVSPEQTAQTVRYLNEMIDALGGYERVQGYADYFEEQGDRSKAQQMRDLLVMQDIFTSSGFAYPQIGAVSGAYSSTLQAGEAALDITGAPEAAAEAMAEAEGVVDANSPLDVPIEATGGAAAIDEQMSIMQSHANRGIGVRVYTGSISMNPVKGYASGGRATEASVFAEDGAEWAIPERHDDNTAALLNAARAASGFSWDELARNGGAAKGQMITLVYSPTIYANDASGVRDALANDKAQFEKWYREKQMRERMEVYA